MTELKNQIKASEEGGAAAESTTPAAAAPSAAAPLTPSASASSAVTTPAPSASSGQLAEEEQKLKEAEIKRTDAKKAIKVWQDEFIAKNGNPPAQTDKASVKHLFVGFQAVSL